MALWTLLLSVPTGLLPLQGGHHRACLMLISGLLCMKEECTPPQSLFCSHPGPMSPVLARSALPGCPSSQAGGQIQGSIRTSSRKPSLTAVDNRSVCHRVRHVFRRSALSAYPPHTGPAMLKSHHSSFCLLRKKPQPRAVTLHFRNEYPELPP